MIKNVVLDFGHGGVDRSGRYTTAPSKMHEFPTGEVAYEGVINRQIGGFLYNILRHHYPTVNIDMTIPFDDPRDLSLSWRVRKVNQYDPSETLLVSIHSNAFDTTVRGFEIFTFPGYSLSDEIAENIFQEVKELYNKTGLKLRYDLSDGDHDKEARFYVLRKTKCPAVLIECLFFDNYSDFKHLVDIDFQYQLSKSIYKGILPHLKN